MEEKEAEWDGEVNAATGPAYLLSRGSCEDERGENR